MPLLPDAGPVDRAQSARLKGLRAVASALTARFSRWRTNRALFYGADDALRPEADRWLADLAAWCGFGKSPFRADPYEAARMAGRQETYLFICEALHLDARRIALLNQQRKDLRDD